MKTRLLALCSMNLLPWVVIAQVSIRLEIISLPPNHVAGSFVYAAGSFNNWNPGDEKYKFKTGESGKYFLELQLQPGNYEYKLTRGSWDKVECRLSGAGIANRALNTAAANTVSIAVEQWVDYLPAKPKISTAGKNVKIIDTAFFIPQLQRYRRIWISLPPDYTNTRQRYPVMYMHDGQNLFDDSSSFAGEWGIDEFFDSTRMQACIVIGIDNGGAKRINEYCPYDMERFGKGEGRAYTDFIAKTLKPWVDKKYRTKKNYRYTYTAGSSMGGLISLYAILRYPKVFGGAGVFSPAFWVGKNIYEEIRQRGRKVKGRVYFYAGKQEGESMVPDMLKAFEAMHATSKSNMTVVIRDDGKHNEPTWRREFPLFYRWLRE